MQCFHDYRRFCPEVSEKWAIDLYLSAPNEYLAPPPMNILVFTRNKIQDPNLLE